MGVLRILSGLGGLTALVLIASSLLRTLVIPRAQANLLTQWIDRVVDVTFQLLVRRFTDYEDRDRVLAAQAAAYLVALLVTWLAGALIGFALLLWAVAGGIGFGAAFREAASSLFTLGFAATQNGAATTVDVIAAFFGLIVVALQISYLPTLYGAFNRRETEVSLLGSRAGSPPWGPELLARTRWGFRVAGDDLPGFYAQWERWAADVAESHANYPILVRFRSPQPNSSWLVGLVAVLDSAAMLLAVAPNRELVQARLCLRMGFTALRQIAVAVGVAHDDDPSPDAEIALTFEEFRRGYDWITDVGFETERTVEEAWPHFRGWRVNYEQIAYELMRGTDAVPALWSGPRRWPTEHMEPIRPANRVPTAAAPAATAATAATTQTAQPGPELSVEPAPRTP